MNAKCNSYKYNFTMDMSSKTLLVCWLSVVLLPFVQTTTQVTAPAGTFQGSVLDDPEGRSYVAFRGIPYAKPPIGKLRFTKPQPVDKIDGIFDATKVGKICPHPSIFKHRLVGMEASEDCLILNVYAKNVNINVPKKVMVYIHGGGYVVGSSTHYFPGSIVSAHDVILVTLNYRLGVLGFLSTGDDSCPGNFALWDMTLALKWVKDNIGSFGGDPDDVTISGESAGGSAVGYLSISPYTKGLFTKAYPQSGSPTSAFGLALTARREALNLAKTLNCYSGDIAEVTPDVTSDILECLRKLPVSDFGSFRGFKINNAEFVPTVDNDFVPKNPHELLKDDAYLKSVGFFDRSYLVGMNNNEASIMKKYIDMVLNMTNHRADLLEKEKEELIKYYLSTAYTFYVTSRMNRAAPREITDNIVDWYNRRFGYETLSQLSSDANFLLPIFDFIDAAARSQSGKVWLFHLNHFPRFMKGEMKGSIHGIDLIYYFDMSVQAIENMLQAGMDGELGMAQEDFRLKRLFGTIIADFVKTGSVSDSEAVKELGVSSWSEYKPTDGSFLDIKPQSELKEGLGRDVRAMWKKEMDRWIQENASRHEEL